MSEENVELVRQALNAWIEVDEGLAHTGRLYEFFAPDATLDLGGVFESAGRHETRGLDEFLEWRAAWAEPYDDWSYNAERILDAGATSVVATFHQRGKLHGRNSWVEMDYGIVYAVRGRLITGAKLYATPQDALDAARLTEQAMPQENVELVRKATDAFNSGGAEAMLPFYAEDVVWYPFPDNPDSSNGFHGHDGIRELLGNWNDSLDDFTVVVHEIRDLGDTVVLLGEISGFIKGTNVPLRQPMGKVVSDFRGGRIGRTRFFSSPEEALEAAGVSEEAVSEENVEVVRRAFEALNRILRRGLNSRDVDAWLEAFHADVEVHELPFPDAQVKRGHDDMRRWIDMTLDVWAEGGRWEPEKVAASGDFVLVAIRAHGSGRASAAPVEARFFQVFEMRDRKIQRIWSYFDEEEALKAAGLSESLLSTKSSSVANVARRYWPHDSSARRDSVDTIQLLL
jgi:ketosteroid isomerase-like protein